MNLQDKIDDLIKLSINAEKILIAEYKDGGGYIHAGLTTSKAIVAYIRTISNKLHELKSVTTKGKLQNKTTEILSSANFKPGGIAQSTFTALIEEIGEIRGYKPKVKQLEWHKYENCVYAYGYMDAKNDIDIVYEIQKHTEQSTMQGYGVSTPTDDDHNTYATLEEAKLAAQSHFEALILGCLE